MGLIVDRLPVPATERPLAIPGWPSVMSKTLQPIVWISIGRSGVFDLPENAPRIPAVLDTGFNQTLLIQDRHLEDWAGIKLADLPVFPQESATHGTQVWPFRMADVWLHPNVSGRDGAATNERPFCLEMHPGILVVSPRQRQQRLPVLGTRGLARNRVQTTLEFPTPALGFLSIRAPD